MTLQDFEDFYRAWDVADTVAKADIQTIDITYQEPGYSAVDTTVTVNGNATPGGPYTITHAEGIVYNTTGSAETAPLSVNLDITSALRELDAQIIDYLAAAPTNTLDSSFSGAGAKLNLVLTGIADGTEITIPGVLNPVTDTNGLIIGAAMMQIKQMIIDAGLDPVSGAPEYFLEHPTQSIIELNGIADDIDISFEGVKDGTNELVKFTVQNGRIVIDTDYIDDVYQAWLASDSYSDPANEPMPFIADPVPSGIATKDGLVVLTEDNLQTLYNYWKAGDLYGVPPLDSEGDVILTIKPRQHTNNDFITQVTLQVDAVDPDDPVYSSAQMFVDVQALASG